MRLVRMLTSHPLTASGLRFVIAGSVVSLIYLGVPVALNGGAHLPIQAAIPIAYVLAVTLHFNLQRHFVFRHVSEFALTRRQQIARYLMIGSIQYPTTAGLTLLLPRFLGLTGLETFLIVSMTMSLTLFVVLRTHIFHANAETGAAEQPLVDELKIAELELLGGCRTPDERDVDAIDAPVQGDR